METESFVKIVEYRSDLNHHFYTLNSAWLKKYFEVEPYDEEVLRNPTKYILNDGGKILFATIKSEVVGTVALLKRGDGVYELTKMAVMPEHQGLKIGQKLMFASLHKASQIGAHRVYLDSNTKLEPAISLYRKIGFREIPVPLDTPYKRCNIRMELFV